MDDALMLYVSLTRTDMDLSENRTMVVEYNVIMLVMLLVKSITWIATVFTLSLCHLTHSHGVLWDKERK